MEDKKLEIIDRYLEEMECKMSIAELISAYPNPDEMYAAIGMIRDIYVAMKAPLDYEEVVNTVAQCCKDKGLIQFDPTRSRNELFGKPEVNPFNPTNQNIKSFQVNIRTLDDTQKLLPLFERGLLEYTSNSIMRTAGSQTTCHINCKDDKVLKYVNELVNEGILTMI